MIWHLLILIIFRIQNWDHQSNHYCGELSNSWDEIFQTEEPCLALSPLFQNQWVIGNHGLGNSRNTAIKNGISKHKFPLVNKFTGITPCPKCFGMVQMDLDYQEMGQDIDFELGTVCEKVSCKLNFKNYKVYHTQCSWWL